MRPSTRQSLISSSWQAVQPPNTVNFRKSHLRLISLPTRKTLSPTLKPMWKNLARFSERNQKQRLNPKSLVLLLLRRSTRLATWVHGLLSSHPADRPPPMVLVRAAESFTSASASGTHHQTFPLSTLSTLPVRQ